MTTPDRRAVIDDIVREAMRDAEHAMESLRVGSPYGEPLTTAVDALVSLIDKAVQAQIVAWQSADPVFMASLAHSEARIITLEEALLKTWYSGEYDRCEVCLHTQHMESTSSGHTPDCLIPSLLERHGE